MPKDIYKVLSLLNDRENALSFNPQLAKEYGLNEAIILSFIRMQLEHSDIYYDCYKWVKLTINELHDSLCFISKDTIKRALCSLESNNLLHKRHLGPFLGQSFDHSNFYAIN